MREFFEFMITMFVVLCGIAGGAILVDLIIEWWFG